MIEMTPVNESFTLQCPCCGVPRLRIDADSQEVVGSRYWLSDGDTISGLWQALTEAQKQPENFDYEMLVGECPSCGGHYYVAEASFMAGARSIIEPYLHFNVELSKTRFFTCTSSAPIDGVPTRWLCAEYETPHGPMHTHTFGPFRLNSSEGVIGPYGVTACASSANDAWKHSSDMLSGLWDDMRRPFMSVAESTA